MEINATAFASMKALVSDSFEIKSCTGKIIIIFLHGLRKWAYRHIKRRPSRHFRLSYFYR